MKIKITKGSEDLSFEVEEASSFGERLMGLMFRKDMESDKGMLIKNCNSIHTFFMRFNIDVLFLDKNYKIVKIINQMRPWRMSRIYFSASHVLELKGGVLSEKFENTQDLEVLCLS